MLHRLMRQREILTQSEQAYRVAVKVNALVAAEGIAKRIVRQKAAVAQTEAIMHELESATGAFPDMSVPPKTGDKK